ncbi:hypothetical protein [Gemmatimonas groenlandica]|uniref:DUF4382 domain-containing protein n=1 Tax=Gemmatimonas groenlandica TaxID=2732249 RepID=A0A6M4IHW0_9BACT|nr:hypothetical protein [Gemmatimonas groenlandica]QJR34200.1 hypothetical protein HKW67_01060 [Gemmatimonas groenlandica]
MKSIPSVLTAAVAALALSACSDGTSPSSANKVGVGFQLARTSTAASMTAASVDGSTRSVPGSMPTITASPAGMNISRDGDVLLVTKAQLVVRNVKLKSATAACADDDDDEATGKPSTSTSGSSSRREDDDECAVIRVGPYLVDVPVSGADGARVAVEVPAGTYSSIRLWLYKVTSGDSADVAFRQANPDFRDISLRLEGTFNGTPFIFVNDVNAKLTVPLAEPLVVGTGGDDVTVTIDLSTWFLRSSGGLYSPAAANTPGQTRAQVQNNIRNAFRAFKDRNKDGRED